MIGATATKVSTHTSAAVNRGIRQKTEENIAKFAEGDPIAIEDRLKELDREWDVERSLQTNFATLALVGVALSQVNRRWLWLTAGVASFMIQHALQGWCPPLPIMRRLGFRSFREIDDERFALKALRGDFQNFDRSFSESTAQA